ncbi:MAG: sulfurtransferase [Candidatus Schekmanbacteria bacterium]|nr:sulfurtransferase [Candidatus Schekmanbacteria bacterium]
MDEPLISAEKLAAHLDDPDWVVADCRFELGRPDWGRAAYAQAHIPGAAYLHLNEELSGDLRPGTGRHPLPDAQALAARLQSVGIGSASRVIAYDDAGGAIAARLWWLLRWLGHAQASLLDGGWAAWCAAGGPCEVAVRPRPERRLNVLVRDALVAQAGELLDRERRARVVLVDARAPERFRGEVEPIDPVAGHIPGALNRFHQGNLAAHGRFLGSGELRARFAPLVPAGGSSAVVHYCGSGVTACHNVLAMEYAGLGGTRLYAGSWSEWIRDPARPVAVGGEDADCG